MGYKRPFTLFLCLIVLAYLIIAPKILLSIDREWLHHGKDEQGVDDWQGVITMWDIPRYTTSGSAFGWIKARISEFERENPGVFIHLRELNYENNKELVLKAALDDSEGGPDILSLYVDHDPIPLENVEILNQWWSMEEIIREEYLSFVTYQQSIYGVPFAASGSVILINTELLDQVGYQAPQKDSWTYEEFMDYIQGFERAKKEREGDENEAYLTFDSYIGKGSLDIMPILLSDGGQIYQKEEDRFAFYQPEMVSGLQKLHNIKSKVTTHQDFGNRSKGDVYQDFFKNKKTLVLAGDSSLIHTLEGLKDQGEGFPYLVMPFPTGSMGIPIWYSHHLDSYAVMKDEDEEKLKVVIQFLESLLEEESQYSLQSLGKFPVHKGVKDLYEEEPLFHGWFQKGYEYQTHPLHPNWEGIEYHIIDCIQSVLANKKSPTQAYKELQNKLNAQ